MKPKLSGRRKKRRGAGKNPSSFFPPLVPIPTPATQAEAL